VTGIASGVDPNQALLWAMPREACEAIYRGAFKRNDRQALRWLARHDRYMLLTCLLRRPDARDDWIYARCREVEIDPDDHIDMWAREHYKMQKLSEPTPTPGGWVKHGDLVPGDQIYGPDGEVCKVVALNKIVDDAECYEIEFDDGFKIKCGGEHLWPIERRTRKRIPMAYNKPGPKRLYRETVVMKTEDIAKHGHKSDGRLAIRVNDPIKMPEANLPADPYVLGAWLGDGTSANSDITCGDPEFFEEAKSAGYEVGHDKSPKRNARCSRIVELRPELETLGVLGNGNKHIPAIYLRASIDQRLSLLQGLMDTDGHCDTRGTATFVNTNDRLVEGFVELCHTLGLKPRQRRHVGKYKGEPYPFWQVSFQAYKDFPPFRLPRKLERCKDGKRPNPRRFIVACSRVPSEPMRCIQVDREDGLYLTGRNMVTTHNSTVITFAGMIQEILKNPEVTIGIFAHNNKAAKSFLIQVKMEFEDNELLKEIFPDILYENPKKQSPRWSEDNGIICKRESNPREATVEASGLVEGLPTGKHYALRVYDDVVTEKSVTTPDMIKKVTEAYDLSEYLGKRGGRQWIIGTRYHFADTYGQLMQRGIFEERRHPATHNGDFDGTPIFLTQKEWDRKLKQPKSTVAAQMLLNPIAGAETTFDVRLLQFWTIRPKVVNVYIMIDPSKGKNEGSDETAIAIVAIDINRNKYLIDGLRHRMPLSKRWTTVRDLYRQYSRYPGVQAVFVGYEQFGMQTDIEYFEERMEIENCPFPMEELKWPHEGRTSKENRIERLEPDFRMGRLRLPKVIEIDEEGKATPIDPLKTKAAKTAISRGQKYLVAKGITRVNEDGRVYSVLSKFLEEFIFFPMAPRDDFLDALSRIYDMDPVAPVVYPDGHDERSGHMEPEQFVDGT